MRKSISIRRNTYDLVRVDCTERVVSMSDYIEQLIAADRAARGLSTPPPSIWDQPRTTHAPRLPLQHAPVVAVEVAQSPKSPQSPQSPTRAPDRHVRTGNAPTVWQLSQTLPAHQAAAKRALATRQAAAPIPTSTDDPARSGRGAHAGDRVPPPQPGRGPANVRMF